MSASGDQRLMNNLGSIVEREYDVYKNDLEAVKEALKGISDFYKKKFKEYQIGKIKKFAQCYYKPSSEEEFDKHSKVVSGKMQAIFTVMKDMNAVVSLPTTQVNTNANKIQEQSSSQFYSQSKPVSLENRGNWLQRHFGMRSELPPELEDAHKMTKDLHLATLNIQQLWKKLLNVHHMGIIREGALSDYMDGEPEIENFYVEGQDEYARIEKMYFHTYVEPEVLKLIERGQQLGREKYLTEIAVRVLTRASEHDERMRLANPMMGQMGLPQKPEGK